MKFLNFFKNFFSVYIGIVLVLILIFTRFVGYQFRRNYACDDIFIFIAIAILVALVFLFAYKFRQKYQKFWAYIKSDKCFYTLLLISSICMVALQIFIDYGAWFIAGWDTRNVIFPDMQMNGDYMSMYPNQVFLAGLFRRIYFLATNLFGLDFYGYYFILVVLSSLCVAASVIFCALVAKKIANSAVATISLLLAVVFVGLSPWIMIPYSDTFAMVCCAFVLFIYCYVDTKIVKWFLMVFVTTIGYFIKPTAIFVFCAVVFVELCFVIKNRKEIAEKIDKKNSIKFGICVLAVLLSFGFSNLFCLKICDYGVQIDENRSFTATHFLMMGINLENHGGWNEDDVSITRSYKNVEEREAGNIQEWLHRLDIYGLNDVAFIVLNKTLTNFNDGSFAWEAELPWCIENCGENPVVWGLYGIDAADAHNDNNNFSAYIRQFLWLAILIGCAFTFLNKNAKREEYVIYLSLLAISAFLTLFEPDSRYLLLYVPFFVIISPKSWHLCYIKYSPKIREIYGKFKKA